MTRICKYCGCEFTLPNNHKVHVCGCCTGKTKLVHRFAIERDKLRVKLGLPPLSSDENTCSIVD